MRKQIFAILTATILLSSLLTGCGAENTSTPPTESNDTSITAEVEATEESTTEEQTEPEETEQPTKTVEPTEEPTPETTEQTEEPALTETVEPEPQYTYTDLSKTMYAKQSVNVRDLPSTDGEKLGGLSTAQEVAVTGQCNETSWYRIEYKDGVGYVSNKYLVNEKPVVEEKPAEQPPQENNGGSNNEVASCPYALYTLIDNGDYIIFYYDYASSNAENQSLKSSLADEAFKIMMGRYTDGQNATGNELAFVGDYKEGQVYSIKTYNYIYTK